MINIDTVYQKVLAIANKEQRGYITPQEFNLFANKAQMDIFEKTFYDYKTALKFPVKNMDNVYNDIEMLREKMLPFNVFKVEITSSGVIKTAPTQDIYWLSSVYDAETGIVFEEHDAQTYLKITSNIKNFGYNIRRAPTKIKPSTASPIYYRVNENTIRSSHNLLPTVCDYIRKPVNPKWGYVVVGGKAMYNAAGAFNFELHPSEESSLVNRILELSGISLNKPGLSELALRNEATNEAAKK